MTGTTRAMKLDLYLIALATVLSCAPNQGYDFGISGRDSRAILQVTNRELDPLQLSLVRGGTTIPIGAVPGLGTRTFLLNASQIGNGDALQLKAGTRANVSAFQSAVFSATIGHRIEWVINRNVASDVVIVK